MKTKTVKRFALRRGLLSVCQIGCTERSALQKIHLFQEETVMSDTILVAVLVVIVAAAAVFGVLVDRGFFNKKKGDGDDAGTAQ